MNHPSTTKQRLTPAEETREVEQAINVVKAIKAHERSHPDCKCTADIWKGAAAR